VNSAWLFLLLFLTVPLVRARPAQENQTPGLSNQPNTLVQNLYQQVVARHPIGIPKGGEMKFLPPTLVRGYFTELI
jgi:hypothetical protein